MDFGTDSDEDGSGIDYEGYIRMLLVMEKAEHKNYRTMGAMELKMISMGHEDFRMKGLYCFGAGKSFF